MIEVASDKDYAAHRVSYLLNLGGPSVCVQTSCSTSLACVAMACGDLALRHSDRALAGAASLLFPQSSGYLYHEGMPESRTGHCCTFDADASGAPASPPAPEPALRRSPLSAGAAEARLSECPHLPHPNREEGSSISRDMPNAPGPADPSIGPENARVSVDRSVAHRLCSRLSFVPAGHSARLTRGPLACNRDDVWRRHRHRAAAAAEPTPRARGGHRARGDRRLRHEQRRQREGSPRPHPIDPLETSCASTRRARRGDACYRVKDRRPL